MISIGNIVAGGTGKTPFTIYLAEKLILKGFKIAIVSRGYGGDLKNRVINNDFDPKKIGDEPSMMAKKLPCPILVGSNKIASIKSAEKLDVDIIILDDGFQSRKIYRDLDIVMLNFNNPFSNNYFLPRGYLRDNPKRLKNANFIVINNSNDQNIDQISTYIKAPIIFTSPIQISINKISGNEIVFPINTKVSAFCAIANPKHFIDLLQKKFEIVDKHFFIDHEFISDTFLKKYAKNACKNGSKAIICTEKDAIKLKNISSEIPICYLKMDLEVKNKENFEKILNAIKIKKHIL